MERLRLNSVDVVLINEQFNRIYGRIHLERGLPCFHACMYVRRLLICNGLYTDYMTCIVDVYLGCRGGERREKK